MTKQQLKKQKRAELVKLAREYNIRGRTTMRKHELIAALLEAAGDDPPPKAETGTHRTTETNAARSEAMTAASVSGPQETVTSTMPDFGSKPEIPPPDLPSGYGDNHIVLMVRDPHWIYAYWELQQDRIQQARDALGDAYDSAFWVIRVYDVTDIMFDGTNQHGHFDIELSVNADNWYIEVPSDGRDYCAEIGVRTLEGRFFGLARSNPVQTPRSGVSDVIDEEWMSREREFERLYTIAGGGGPETATGSLGLRELMEQRLHAMLFSPGISSFGASVLR